MNNNNIYIYKESEKKSYEIYKNDLKHQKDNNINLDNIINFNDFNKFNTLQYRFDECFDEDGLTLDLTQLDLTKLPSNIPKTVKYLFISSNNFSVLPNLKYFENLIAIDISFNNISNLPLFSSSIEEIICNNNRIINLDSLINYKNLKRLNCSNNKIETIPCLNNLELLICNDNEINELNIFPNLLKLNCNNNKIKIIENLPKLKKLECDSNKIMKINNLTCLEELYCNDNCIIGLDNIYLNNIKILHCYHNNIQRIDYYSSLEELLCDNDKVYISKIYKEKDRIDEIINYKNNVKFIVFKNNNNNIEV